MDILIFGDVLPLPFTQQAIALTCRNMKYYFGNDRCIPTELVLNLEAMNSMQSFNYFHRPGIINRIYAMIISHSYEYVIIAFKAKVRVVITQFHRELKTSLDATRHMTSDEMVCG